MTLSRLWPIAAFLAVGLACLVAGIWLRVIYEPEWKTPDTNLHPAAIHPWVVEADCYSQLARVQRILHGQGLIQRHFAVENWPEGLYSSTTAPFDYAILLLYAPLCLFVQRPLDWAGALVSPALWVALVLFWTFIRSREFNLTGRAILLIGSTALPAFLWATACGRPRHQSLILALMAMALTAEYERWQIELTPKRAWNIFAGIAWGFACWTSLFEPSIVLGCLILFNLIVRRKENVAFLVSFACVTLVAFAIEGTHTLTASALLLSPSAEYQTALRNWLGTIAEIQGVNFAGMMQSMTLILLLCPFFAWKVWPRNGGNKTDAFIILLTLLLTILTITQRRWLYYASLAELFLLVRYCQVTPARWVRVAVMALVFAGIIDADVTQFQSHANVQANQPSQQLMQISRAIDQPGGILAPWWLSPGLLYFSGHPIVSGSSHCGISGIAASAKFFTSTSWADAERILNERKVRWIVVWDDPAYVYPLLNTSLGILGLPFVSDDAKGNADSTTAQLLITDQYLPTAFRLRAVTAQLKLYEYVPTGS